MPIFPPRSLSVPNAWSAFGHSYINYSAGTFDQTGRLDARFRAVLDIELNHWQNFGVTGSRFAFEGAAQGGWATVMREVNKNAFRSSPYTGSGGGMLLCSGINDMGLTGVTTQIRTAFINAVRASISRWRASTIKENTDASIVYGSGWAVQTNADIASGGTYHMCSTTGVNSSFTITLPADYLGEPICLSFIGRPGVTAGTVIFSGTAGITGTLSLSDVLPAATFSTCVVPKRITTLTSANASQTIVVSANTLDAGGQLFFDCWWIEAKDAPPVILCNIARLTAAGYAGYGGWAGTEAQKDADVATWNADLTTLAGEFDSMVQIADIDAALNKVATLYFDGLHPNEAGASLCADAILVAANRLYPTGPGGKTASMNPPCPQAGSRRMRRAANNYYTSDFAGSGSSYTAVSGNMFAIPFEVTEPADRYDRLALETVAAVAGTTVRWGVYSDIGNSGYPDLLMVEATLAGVFTVPTATGPQLCPTSGAGSIYLIIDPGMYWLTIKFCAIGVSHTFVTGAGPVPGVPSVTTAGAFSTAKNAGWKLTGQGTGAFPSTFPAGAALVNNVPYIGIHKS